MAKWKDQLTVKERAQLAKAEGAKIKYADELRKLTSLLKNRCEQRKRRAAGKDSEQ